jgi:hypothetical protein
MKILFGMSDDALALNNPKASKKFIMNRYWINIFLILGLMESS